MITSLQIKSYRGISKCNLRGLKTVNVLTGRNNHGKSSILESLYLASGAFRFDNPWITRKRERTRPHDFRDSKIEQLLNRRTNRSLSWNERESLWYNYNDSQPIEVNFVYKGRKSKIRLANWHFHPMLQIQLDEVLLKNLKAVGVSLVNTGSHTLCLIEQAIVRRHQSHGLSRQALDIIDREVPVHRLSEFMQGIMFIDSGLIRDFEIVEKALWNALLKRRHDKLIVEVLKIGYEVDVEDLTYMPVGERYQLAVKLPHTTARVDDLGDGARYSMLWIMVAALAHNTAIIIEEPENHQHPGGLAKSLEMLLDLVKKNNTQLFFTTHSLEFIKLLEEIARERKINVGIFFIEMEKDGKIEPRSISPKDSDILTKMGLDIRFLDVL